MVLVDEFHSGPSLSIAELQSFSILTPEGVSHAESVCRLPWAVTRVGIRIRHLGTFHCTRYRPGSAAFFLI